MSMIILNFSYYKSVDDALISGYEHNTDLYKLLLNDEDVKRRVLGIYMEDIYKSLKRKMLKRIRRFYTKSGREITYYGYDMDICQK